MAYSYAETTASGSSANVTVPFPYLDKAHVKVYLDAVLVDSATYTWPSSGQIALGATPDEGVVVRVQRDTPVVNLETVFSSPDVLAGPSLNRVLKQLLYVVQEAFDVATATDTTLAGITDYINTSLATIAGYASATAGHVATVAGYVTTTLGYRNEAEAFRDAAEAAADAVGTPAPASRTLTPEGLLLLDGGAVPVDLSANRTISVPKAGEAEVTAGSDDTKAITAKALADAGLTIPAGRVRTGYFLTAAPGWCLLVDGTFGDTGSGATYAGPEYEAVYTAVYNSTDNAECAVSTGRGASAAADFAAGKTIAQPKTKGRAFALYGTGSGLTARAMAKAVGEESHTPALAEMVSHGHPWFYHSGTSPDGVPFVSRYSQGGPPNMYSVGDASSGTGTTGTVVGNAGSSSPFNVMSPYAFMNAEIKL